MYGIDEQLNSNIVIQQHTARLLLFDTEKILVLALVTAATQSIARQYRPALADI